LSAGGRRMTSLCPRLCPRVEYMLEGEDVLDLRLTSKAPDEALEYTEESEVDALEGCRKGELSAVCDCRSGCGLYDEAIVFFVLTRVLSQPETVGPKLTVIRL
jgi:hypothetical protein